MIRAKRAGAVSIVAISTVVACLAVPELATVRQEAVVAPASVEFGDATIGSTLNREIVVSPAGTTAQNDRIDAIDAPCAEFSVDLARLPIAVTRVCGATGTDADQQPFPVGDEGVEGNAVQVPCTTTVGRIPVTFAPRVTGTATCNVTLRGTFGSLSVLLRGTGVLPQLAISVTPTDVGFGDVRINTTSAPATIAIRNAGSQPLQITGVSVMPAGVFAIGGANGSHALAPGAIENHPLTCTPTSTSSFTAAVQISSNAQNAPAVSIPVSCQGTDSAIEMVGAPAELVTRVKTPRDQVITITNTGTAQSELKEITLVNSKGLDELAFVTAPKLATLGPGESLSPPIEIRFAASAEIGFGELGRLRVLADDRTTELVINGAAQAVSVGLNPDGVALGPVCIGTTGVAQLAVFASAEGEFELTSVDAPEPPFEFRPIDPPVLPATAMGGHLNDLMLEASVTPTVAGPLSATAVLAVDIRANPTRVVTLTAEGLEAGVSAFPRALDFGTITVPEIAQGQTVGLTNCNDTAIEVLGARITGPDEDEFSIVLPAVIARTLERKARLDLVLVMSPRSAGPKTAQLVIQLQGGEQTVELVGNGDGGPGPLPRDTYYRCNAGGPGGALPLAGVLIALLGLCRRRRPHQGTGVKHQSN